MLILGIPSGMKLTFKKYKLGSSLRSLVSIRAVCTQALVLKASTEMTSVPAGSAANVSSRKSGISIGPTLKHCLIKFPVLDVLILQCLSPLRGLFEFVDCDAGAHFGGSCKLSFRTAR